MYKKKLIKSLLDRNLFKKNNATLIGDLQPGWYWSSTQASEDSYYGFYYKVNPDVEVIEQRVRCLHKKKMH